MAVEVIPGDLADPETPGHLRSSLRAAGIEVNVLVNNAGFGSQGPFHQERLSSQLQMIRVNVEALTHLTGLFLPEMVRRGSGGILQVASTAAFQPGPHMAVYYATKAYVLHFAEAIREEVRRAGVTVTALCPGPVPTAFQERAEMEDVALARGAVPMLSAERVAEAGYRGLVRGEGVVIPGTLNRLGATAVRFVPRAVVRKVTGRLNAGPGSEEKED